jgi:hypothetical protein
MIDLLTLPNEVGMSGNLSDLPVQGKQGALFIVSQYRAQRQAVHETLEGGNV